METELRDRLQSTLGERYTLERELGGGAMSRVFVAEQRALGRRVVIKVLSPELASGVNVERFVREIQVAARLQHPHIVPLLSAGQAAGVPYYTMPYVAGESLRSRLKRDGTLPIAHVVSVLRDVASALAYAHREGVVHRDIKPDNVLLSDGRAQVADFGLAKALDAAAPEGSLTATGIAVGTPAYMAPEQATGDPGADHRVDLYALGALAYEALTGCAPFKGPTPQAVLAAHVMKEPEPVADRRQDVPPALAALVMRCLAKQPSDRPRSADEVAGALELAASGGRLAVRPATAVASRRALARALAFYAGAFLLVAAIARAAITAVGLPEWVYPAALVVMALGLPAVLLTALVHHAARGAHAGRTPTPGSSDGGASAMAALATRARPHVTWRRTALAGALAVGTLVLFTGGYMALRAMGVGPAGSLMAAGVLGERERIIVADFRSPPADTTLGPVVAEAFRTDLAQSRNLAVFQQAAVRGILRRMQRPETARVHFTLAREMASREGLRALVDGEVVALGGSYVLSARLVAAQTGEELALFRETADDARELIPAIGRLSKQVRARVGESLRTVQRTQPLERVTTGSLDALRKYVEGSRAVGAGEFERGQRLLREAIALDTGFAMAYRRLSSELSNRRGHDAEVLVLIQKAYDHRDRLSDLERDITVGSYFWDGPSPDIDRAIEAFEAAVQRDSLATTAWNNAGALYRHKRQLARAESCLARVLRFQRATGIPVTAISYQNLASAQFEQGKVAEAERTVEQLARAAPGTPSAVSARSAIAYLKGRPDSAAAILRAALAGASSPVLRELAANRLALLAMRRGRLAEAAQLLAEARASQRARGVAAADLEGALDEVFREIAFRDRNVEALRLLDEALARHPLDPVPPLDRPFARIAELYALAGRPDRARQMLAAFDAARRGGRRFGDDWKRSHLEGMIAMAERRLAEAVAAFRAADKGSCTICELPHLARAYDEAGHADSAVAALERYLTTPFSTRLYSDATFLAPTHRRLGELYETKGDRARAAEHYAAFVGLWKDADSELQPQVREVRGRLARLQRAERP